MRTPRDIAGFLLPLVVLIISLSVVIARNTGVPISSLEFGLACGFGSISLLVLVLSIPGSSGKPGKDGESDE
ncbi:MAG: hypothetical protein JNM17_07450 [Archangium sp.]|nr:hypothetical protein [Archangium sp.]